MNYNTRIKLKSDIEANWNKLAANGSNPGFIPLQGELIIYSPDDNYSYSRLKIGDGITNIIELPFVDSGTLNGKETELVKLPTFQDFPSPGSPDKLYVDLSTNLIYHYASTGGYTQLSSLTFSFTKTSVSKITTWSAGTKTEMNVNNNILQLKSGLLPELFFYNTNVVQDIQGG